MRDHYGFIQIIGTLVADVVRETNGVNHWSKARIARDTYYMDRNNNNTSTTDFYTVYLSAKISDDLLNKLKQGTEVMVIGDPKFVSRIGEDGMRSKNFFIQCIKIRPLISLASNSVNKKVETSTVKPEPSFKNKTNNIVGKVILT